MLRALTLLVIILVLQYLRSDIFYDASARLPLGVFFFFPLGGIFLRISECDKDHKNRCEAHGHADVFITNLKYLDVFCGFGRFSVIFGFSLRY